MAVTRDIYCNFTDGRLVRSNKDATYVTLPAPFHEYNLRLIIHPLEVDPSRALNLGPFAELDPDGWALNLSIFNSSGSSVLAQQTSWTAEGNTLVGSLNCNTANMVTAMTGVNSIQAVLEFEFTDANGKITIQQSITINREYITSGTPAPLENESYLTESASRAIFVAKQGAAGEGLYLTSPDGTKVIFCYCDDNGVFRSDLVT